MSDSFKLYPDPLWVNVSLSGGGHRATVWGYGTLFALIRARERGSGAGKPNLKIASVASVSGGSIANGVVTQEIQDLNSATEIAFLVAVRGSIRNILDVGLIPGPPTNRYLRGFFATAVLAVAASLVVVGALTSTGRDWDTGAYIVPAIILAIFALLFGVWRLGRGGSVPLKKLLMQTAGAAVAGAAIGLGMWLGSVLDGWQATRIIVLLAVLSAALWWIAVSLFALRGRQVETALADLFFSANGRPTRLSELDDRVVHHVFCATEQQSGDHIYLTPKLMHGYLTGETPRPTMSLAQAVQASASLPGAFPPQETQLLPGVELERSWTVKDNEPEPPVQRIVLVDGGVYDNMGEQWAAGFDRRARRSELVAGSQERSHFMVVSNSGKALGWRQMLPTNKVLLELRGLMRDQQIQYDATTSQRRRAVVASFRAGAASGKGPIGVMVHMGTSPIEVCKAFESSPDSGQRSRARAMLAHLGRSTRWDEIVDHNADVGTVLSKLDSERVLDLIEHSAVLTLVGLYVVHGIGQEAIPQRDELRQLFETGSTPV